MPPATITDSHVHLAPPLTHHDLSRSPSPQSDLSLLVSDRHHPPLHSADPAILHATDPSGRTALSVHSLLTGPHQAPSNTRTQTTWSSPMPPPPPPRDGNAVPGPSTPTQVSFIRPNKRRLDASDGEDPASKIRRVVRDHVTQDPARVLPMTTVLCLHAAVAQKSYGTEKRFLCPPPVVHIEGPDWHLKQQQLSMAVVSEGGDRGCEQKAPLDHNLTASFKFLHVNGTAKAKSFQLSLDIAEPPPPVQEGSDPGRGRVWASFDSAPVTIISKPSKKTAKTRNISSCILAGGPVSLFNRINSQTVRTKYMTVDNSQLCASNVSWSAFNVNVIRSTASPLPESHVAGGPQPVTYGSEVVLADTVSGTQTAPLIIRKVDKGRIVQDDNGPVSQMQKVALQRKDDDGSRQYLSAAGPMPGTPGTVVPPTPGLSNQAGSHPLLFQAPRSREEIRDGGLSFMYDEVDDYLCWTIVGISKFQYTFFDALGQNSTIPDLPITPFPTLFSAPLYRTQSHTMELTASNFFYENPKTRTQLPLDIYIGNIGPLRFRIYPPPDPETSMGSAHNVFMQPPTEPTHGPNGEPLPPFVPMFIPTAARYMPMGATHTILIVEMPPINNILKSLMEDALSTEESDGESPRSGEPTSAGQRKVDASSIIGRSLPILFIRSFDGVGYHSGRAVQAENVFQNIDLSGPNPATSAMDPSWISAAHHAASTVDGGLHGWTIRVI
ncbi:hypothetical protein BKA93DRAFT_722358 [Sparassis latifolia]